MVAVFFFSLALFFLQGLAALPWLIVLLRRPLAENFPFYLKMLGGVTAGGIVFAMLLQSSTDPFIMSLWGRLYASVLTLQIAIDLFVLVFRLMLIFWSKGGAVALAAFQEGVRQPMFWMLTLLGSLFMFISVVIPYFTFGEDLKMVKEISYALTMMFPAIFGVISAGTSVSEEIEGRTAVTLLSKPINRRQFLIGKFMGIMLAGILMTMLMGWSLIWVVLAKIHYDYVPGIYPLPPDPVWLNPWADQTFGRTISGDLAKGIALWLRDTLEAMPGLIIGFGQVMTLIAVSVALATRVPKVVNLSMCLVVYFLGHLTPIMTEVSQGIRLVHFFAQLFELLLPDLDLFDVGTAIVRDVPLDPDRYALYTANVALYAIFYTAIANLVGLILFEDRDVA